jgi:aminopeptidase N
MFCSLIKKFLCRLNEGFATLFQYNLVDIVEPTWRMQAFMNTFTMINVAFVTDSWDSTRPMTNDVNTLSEISRAFDNVAYDKSGCVLRMFERAVGENIFRRSLELYLKTK